MERAKAGITWVLQTDLVNISRGRAVVDADVTTDPPPTVGWVPADLGLDAFGGLADTPWGAVGDIRLRPRPGTRVEIDPNPDPGGPVPPFRFVLADCIEKDGDRWSACPTRVLRDAVDTLDAEFGLQIQAAVEHEFALRRTERGLPFSIDAARRAEPLLSAIVDALDQAGLEPEHILPEFGHNQFEVTVDPAIGEAAADRVVMTREIIRDVARTSGEAVSFAPVIGVGAGTSGAHLHTSLLDRSGQSIMTAPDRPLGLSDRARSFAAGIMAHLPALTALTAPSVVSYLRLRPRQWSAGYRAFGVGNREVALRISPGRPAGGGGRSRLGPSLELRSHDATANPYLALAAVLTAGMDGLRRELELGQPAEVDPSLLSPSEREALGITELPRSLGEALDALEADKQLRTILGPELDACWFTLKRAEVDRFAGASEAEIIEAYVDVY